VFGLFCRKTKIAILEHVRDRRNSTLAALISQYCEPACPIMSDQMASYVTLASGNSTLPGAHPHFWVNHSEEFVHSKFTFVHTNNIERTWRSFKRTISVVKRSVAPEAATEYCHAYSLRTIVNEEKLYDFML